MNQDLGPILVKRKSGAEPFHHDGQPLGFDVLNFWQWSSSDLLSNATRGILAEYLVALALGDADDARAEWDPFDATSEEGIRVEVKSSAYLQSWHQDKLSRITFDIKPTYGWDAATNLRAQERKRQADVYVFCLLAHKDQATVDPLNLAQWRFFVLPTRRLNEKLGEQESIGLGSLRKIGAEEVAYDELLHAVQQAARHLAV